MSLHHHTPSYPSIISSSLACTPTHNESKSNQEKKEINIVSVVHLLSYLSLIIIMIITHLQKQMIVGPYSPSPLAIALAFAPIGQFRL